MSDICVEKSKTKRYQSSSYNTNVSTCKGTCSYSKRKHAPASTALKVINTTADKRRVSSTEKDKPIKTTDLTGIKEEATSSSPSNDKARTVTSITMYETTKLPNEKFVNSYLKSVIRKAFHICGERDKALCTDTGRYTVWRAICVGAKKDQVTLTETINKTVDKIAKDKTVCLNAATLLLGKVTYFGGKKLTGICSSLIRVVKEEDVINSRRKRIICKTGFERRNKGTYRSMRPINLKAVNRNITINLSSLRQFVCAVCALRTAVDNAVDNSTEKDTAACLEAVKNAVNAAVEICVQNYKDKCSNVVNCVTDKAVEKNLTKFCKKTFPACPVKRILCPTTGKAVKKAASTSVSTICVHTCKGACATGKVCPKRSKRKSICVQTCKGAYSTGEICPKRSKRKSNKTETVKRTCSCQCTAITRAVRTAVDNVVDGSVEQDTAACLEAMKNAPNVAVDIICIQTCKSICSELLNNLAGKAVDEISTESCKETYPACPISADKKRIISSTTEEAVKKTASATVDITCEQTCKGVCSTEGDYPKRSERKSNKTETIERTCSCQCTSITGAVRTAVDNIVESSVEKDTAACLEAVKNAPNVAVDIICTHTCKSICSELLNNLAEKTVEEISTESCKETYPACPISADKKRIVSPTTEEAVKKTASATVDITCEQTCKGACSTEGDYSKISKKKTNKTETIKRTCSCQCTSITGAVRTAMDNVVDGSVEQNTVACFEAMKNVPNVAVDIICSNTCKGICSELLNNLAEKAVEEISTESCNKTYPAHPISAGKNRIVGTTTEEAVKKTASATVDITCEQNCKGACYTEVDYPKRSKRKTSKTETVKRICACQYLAITGAARTEADNAVESSVDKDTAACFEAVEKAISAAVDICVQTYNGICSELVNNLADIAVDETATKSCQETCSVCPIRYNTVSADKKRIVCPTTGEAVKKTASAAIAITCEQICKRACSTGRVCPIRSKRKTNKTQTIKRKCACLTYQTCPLCHKRLNSKTNKTKTVIRKDACAGQDSDITGAVKNAVDNTVDSSVEKEAIACLAAVKKAANDICIQIRKGACSELVNGEADEALDLCIQNKCCLEEVEDFEDQSNFVHPEYKKKVVCPATGGECPFKPKRNVTHPGAVNQLPCLPKSLLKKLKIENC